jgi:hypothetical protein
VHSRWRRTLARAATTLPSTPRNPGAGRGRNSRRGVQPADLRASLARRPGAGR